jgi:FG-GAP repeat
MRLFCVSVVFGALVVLFGGVSADAAQAGLVESRLRATKFGSEYYGWSVATTGSIAVVGIHPTVPAPGLVEVFTRSGASWTHSQTVTPSDGAAGDEFGQAVAVSGSVIVLGAPAKGDHGAVYVFTDSGGSWTQTQELSSPDPGDFNFGGAVATSNKGNTILVRADTTTTGGGARRAVYVFSKSGSSWTESQKLVPQNPTRTDEFGEAIAVSGDTALIGDPGKHSYAGIADVFTESSGVWAEKARLEAPHPKPTDEFGAAVAISGSQVIVGAPYRRTSIGAAYAFGGPSWKREAALPCPNAAGGRIECGWSVSISGTSAVVGAPRKYTGKGVAEQWTRTRSGWSYRRELEASNALHKNQFGQAVAISGLVIVIGAPYKGARNQGAAFAYTG